MDNVFNYIDIEFTLIDKNQNIKRNKIYEIDDVYISIYKTNENGVLKEKQLLKYFDQANDTTKIREDNVWILDNANNTINKKLFSCILTFFNKELTYLSDKNIHYICVDEDNKFYYSNIRETLTIKNIHSSELFKQYLLNTFKHYIYNKDNNLDYNNLNYILLISTKLNSYNDEYIGNISLVNNDIINKIQGLNFKDLLLKINIKIELQSNLSRQLISNNTLYHDFSKKTKQLLTKKELSNILKTKLKYFSFHNTVKTERESDLEMYIILNIDSIRDIYDIISSFIIMHDNTQI